MTAVNRTVPRDEALNRMRTQATVNVYDTMAILGLGEVTVRRAIADGEIKTIRFGHRIHVLTAPLMRQLGID